MTETTKTEILKRMPDGIVYRRVMEALNLSDEKHVQKVELVFGMGIMSEVIITKGIPNVTEEES